MLAAALAVSACGMGKPTPPEVRGADPVSVGRHVVRIGGCNDCHTADFMLGPVDESVWLKGSGVGFRGPWGVTYASNLRLTVDSMTEDDWVVMLSTRNGAPPMPWPSVHALSDAEKRALYRYIQSLGAPGAPAPVALPPGYPVHTPVIDMFPKAPD